MILVYCASSLADEIVKQIDCADALNKSITTINYNFTKLKKWGLINNKNQLTDYGKKFLQHFKRWDKTLKKRIRSHNLQVRLYLTKLPKDFEKLYGSILTPFTNKRYKGLKIQLNGCSVMFYSHKKVIVKLPDIFGNNEDEVASALLDCITQIIDLLKLEFPGLEVNCYEQASVTTMHVAVLDSVIAEQYILKKGSHYSDGRISVDKSHGVYELEAEDPKTALADVEVLVKSEDLTREIEALRTKIKKYESLIEEFRKNKESHSK